MPLLPATEHAGPAAAVWLFAACVGFIAYTYAGYPLLIAAWARLRPKPVDRDAAHRPSVAIVLACHNEAGNIERRVANLLEQDYPAERVELIAVSDGSTDATPDILRRLADEHDRLHAVILEANGGKAVALNAGIAAARNELIVFADARQHFRPDVVARLAENFADPAVGSVSGELILREDNDGEAGGDGGVAQQVGLYWRYEKAIRRAESQAGSMLGATGAIYAIRRELYRPLPAGTLLDDFLTPMRIVLAGRRAVFDGRAVAEDRVSTRAGQEYRRKVRTLAGNYQAVAFEPALLWPWSNPTTWFQLWSHKLFRLLVPFAMLGALATSLALLPGSVLFAAAAAAQLAFYDLAFIGWQCERRGRPIPWKVASLAWTFVALNTAAAAGLWVWLRGADRVWKKAYTEPAPQPTDN